MKRNTCKYPLITVQLTGRDVNAFAIMGAVVKALRENGASKDDVEQFRQDAISGSYDDLLRTCMQWVNVE